MEEAEGVGQEVGFGVESDEVVVDRAFGVGRNDGLGVDNAWVGGVASTSAWVGLGIKIIKYLAVVHVMLLMLNLLIGVCESFGVSRACK